MLFRRQVLQLRPWLRLAYKLQEATPPELLPRWPPFRPLPQGAAYPPLAFARRVVDYGLKEVGR